MSVAIYMDVHVAQAITNGLRRRGVDVLTAQEDGRRELEDDELLERSTALKRILFTQDVRFKAMAESWQASGRQFGGLAYAHQSTAMIGPLVKDLELIAKAMDQEEWRNYVQHLPYR